MRRKYTPYQRIMRAAKKGIGVRISAEEIQDMCMDTAITDAAWSDDEDMGLHELAVSRGHLRKLIGGE